MQNAKPLDEVDQQMVTAFKALANEKRLQILYWLRDPQAHFPSQQEGDLVADGVCGIFIAEKLSITQPTLHEHMRILVNSGIVRQKKIKQWTFYQRDDGKLSALAEALSHRV